MNKHQNLINLELQVTKIMNTLTNDMYVNGTKFKYVISWLKGTGTIDNGLGDRTTQYYTLKMYIVDKTNSIEGKQIDLYTNHYTLKGVLNIHALHEQALLEFITNGVRSLFNITFAQYQEQMKVAHIAKENAVVDEKIEMLRESANKETIPLFKA